MVNPPQWIRAKTQAQASSGSFCLPARAVARQTASFGYKLHRLRSVFRCQLKSDLSGTTCACADSDRCSVSRDVVRRSGVRLGVRL